MAGLASFGSTYLGGNNQYSFGTSQYVPANYSTAQNEVDHAFREADQMIRRGFLDEGRRILQYIYQRYGCIQKFAWFDSMTGNQWIVDAHAITRSNLGDPRQQGCTPPTPIQSPVKKTDRSKKYRALFWARYKKEKKILSFN